MLVIIQVPFLRSGRHEAFVICPHQHNKLDTLFNSHHVCHSVKYKRETMCNFAQQINPSQPLCELEKSEVDLLRYEVFHLSTCARSRYHLQLCPLSDFKIFHENPGIRYTTIFLYLRS